MRKAAPRIFLAALAPPTVAGCDPVVNIAGAFFPAWLCCAIAGMVVAAIVRLVFHALGWEQHLGPLPLLYFSLAVLVACGIWLIFFNRA